MRQDRHRARAIAIAATEAESRTAWLRLGLMTGLLMTVVGLAFTFVG